MWPVNRDANPTNAAAARAMFLNCADWMLQNITRLPRFHIWKYDYQMVYGTGSGWGSAHAQAVGMQLLIRASDLTHDGRYVEELPALLAVFEFDVKDGGLRDDFNGNVWFEKFADPDNQKPRVLNGMLFSLMGLREVSETAGLDRASSLYHEGVESVAAHIDKFDLGYWSAYDILGRPASAHYHDMHIRQLDYLHSFDKSPWMKRWRNRFASQRRRKKVRMLASAATSLFTRRLRSRTK